MVTLTLATAGITILVTSTHGPFEVFAIARDRYEHHAVLSALSCPWCFALWVSALLHLLLWVADGLVIVSAMYFVQVFAVAFVAGAMCWAVRTVDDYVEGAR